MSHYDWLEKHLVPFMDQLDMNTDFYNNGLIGAHGDKCYGYRYQWNEAGIPFEHGVAIYLLTYCNPFSKEVRETDAGWVDPGKWVKDNYPRFKQFLTEVN